MRQMPNQSPKRKRGVVLRINQRQVIRARTPAPTPWRLRGKPPAMAFTTAAACPLHELPHGGITKKRRISVLPRRDTEEKRILAKQTHLRSSLYEVKGRDNALSLAGGGRVAPTHRSYPIVRADRRLVLFTC